MILALPYCQGELVALEQADIFAIYRLENNQVVDKQLIQPGLSGEDLIEHFYRLQVNRVILPEVSDDTKFDLDYFQMGYVTGVSGQADELVERFLEGAFEDDD